MGLEWHDRPHDQRGQWIKKHEYKNTDIHIRLSKETAERLRHEAVCEHLEISQYVDRVLRERWEAEDNAGSSFQRRSLGVPKANPGPDAKKPKFITKGPR